MHSAYTRITSGEVAKYPGERHAVTYNPSLRGWQLAHFIGPGTRLDLRRLNPIDWTPVNSLDETAKKHDLAYESAKMEYDRTKDKKAFTGRIWKSDEEFIKAANADKDDPDLGHLAAKLMTTKMLGEKSGVLRTSKFSGAGSKRISKRSIQQYTAPFIEEALKQKKKKK